MSEEQLPRLIVGDSGTELDAALLRELARVLIDPAVPALHLDWDRPTGMDPNPWELVVQSMEVETDLLRARLSVQGKVVECIAPLEAVRRAAPPGVALPTKWSRAIPPTPRNVNPYAAPASSVHLERMRPNRLLRRARWFLWALALITLLGMGVMLYLMPVHRGF